ALFSAILNTGYKAPLPLLVIPRQEERQLIQAIQVFVKNIEEILATCVQIFTSSGYLIVGPPSQFLTSLERHDQSPCAVHG
ncbi:MAG TPA: hypothetical protein VGK96_13985, partial [Candidatus Sulfotelmatobacter sp.]